MQKSFNQHLIDSLIDKPIEKSFRFKTLLKVEVKDIFGESNHDRNMLKVYIMSRVVNWIKIADEKELLILANKIINSTKGALIYITRDNIVYDLKEIDKDSEPIRYSMNFKDMDYDWLEASSYLAQIKSTLLNKRKVFEKVDPDNQLINLINDKLLKCRSEIDKQPSYNDRFTTHILNTLSFIDKIIIQQFKENS